MNWTNLLTSEIEATYGAAEGLVRLVDEAKLNWKPPTGENWMTLGQLLQHLPTACGFCCRGFLTGEWDIPEGEMLPSAEKMPSAKSSAEVLQALGEDKQAALAMVAEAGEENLANRKVPAPWDPTPKTLGEQFLMSIQHLGQHKGQLFYYLKLQGKPVHTGHLWGTD